MSTDVTWHAGFLPDDGVERVRLRVAGVDLDALQSERRRVVGGAAHVSLLPGARRQRLPDRQGLLPARQAATAGQRRRTAGRQAGRQRRNWIL